MPKGLLLLFVLLCVISILMGVQQMTWTSEYFGSEAFWLTLTASRLPRLVALILTGIGLAVCGVILQHIVRNKFVEAGTSGGLDAAKLGILVALTTLPSLGTSARMLFAVLFCFWQACSMWQ